MYGTCSIPVIYLEQEKAMAPHSSALAWRIPWTEEPGALWSMVSLGVGYDWATLLWLFTFMHWRRKWQPTRVLAWRIPGPGEPGGLPSVGSHRVGHDWRDWANYGGGSEDDGDLLQKIPCMHCYTQCPQPCSRPPLTQASAGDSWTLTGKSGSISFKMERSGTLMESWSFLISTGLSIPDFYPVRRGFR